MDQIKPKKNLGQHFLNDGIIAEKIVSSLMEVPGINHVLEIGPGMGVLTEYLIKHDIKLEVIEIDTEAVHYLKAKFPMLENRILHSDFLKLSFSRYKDRVSIIGNFPYNISTEILFKILEHKEQVNCMVGMFQKEVAARIASAPGNKDYGIPSVLLQAWYDIEYLFTVDENKFNPPPRVKSGVIRMIRNKQVDLGCDEKRFTSVVKIAFNQRRKMLRNSLKSTVNEEKLITSPYAKSRPEELHWKQFAEIASWNQ